HRPDPLTLTPALRSGFSRVRDAVDRGHHRTRTTNGSRPDLYVEVLISILQNQSFIMPQIDQCSATKAAL
ncbi:hypothetical protein, partial [Methylobacterium sp. Leaf87]|uniref:hypothetical protein n=1 Tax=Methylobacterium sp. Leaf87 TaxID=1736243 RepID=UPI001AEC2085